MIPLMLCGILVLLAPVIFLKYIKMDNSDAMIGGFLLGFVMVFICFAAICSYVEYSHIQLGLWNCKFN